MNSLTKILIVEHDPTDLELLQRELNRGELKYVSEVVQNEQDYINALINFVPDIVLSDYQLPSFDGPTAFTLRGKIAPYTPFIFVSGTIGEENSIELIKNGLTDYVLKDKLFTLNTKVNRALEEAKAKLQKIKDDENLRKSEAKFRNLMEASPDALVGANKNGEIIYVNTQATILFGYTNDELLNQKVELLLPERFRRSHIGHRDGYIAKQGSRTMGSAGMDLFGRRKDGSEFATEISLKSIETEEGLIVLSIIRDITEKRKMEQQLRKSEAFNRGVLNSLSSHIAVIDGEGNIVATNQAWKNFAIENGDTALERTAEGINYFNVCEKAAKVGDAIGAATLQGMKEVLDKKRTLFYLEYPCHAPKEKRWFSLRVMNFESDEPMLVIAHQVITERKMAEQAMHKSHEQLEKLTDNVPAAVFQFEMDKDGNMAFDFMSEGIQLLMPWLTAEQVMKDASLPFAAVHPEDLPELMATIENSRQQLTEWERDIRMLTLEGNIRWIFGSAHPERAENGKTVWYGFLDDITEKKGAEDEIRALNENLEELVRERTSELIEANTALEAFSYSVSHDLKAPVRTLMGFAKLIHNDYGHTFEPELKELFDHIESSSRRMNAIIEDLLKLAKYGKEKLHEGEVNMTKLFSKVWDNIRFSYPHNAVIEIKELPIVRGDSSMLEQVIVNLLSNAVKYSSKKEKPQIEVGYEETNDGFDFYVKDNGAGFDMKDYERLFGAFHRLHGMSEFEGTGIGLTLVKRIVEKHEGRVWAEAQVGEGATFYFTLPVKN